MTVALAVTLPRLVAAEWVKLRSVRSTPLTLLASLALMISLGVLVCSGVAIQWAEMDAAERASFDPTRTSLAGAYLAQLAVGALGVLAITGEYSTGTIRASMAAAPRRLPVLWAKTIAYAAATFVASLVTALVAFGFGQAVLSGKDIGASLGDPGVPRALVGAALYLTMVGLFGIGLGTVLRSTAGALSTLFAVLLVLPILASFLPADLASHVEKYLPSNAGMAIMSAREIPGTLAPWSGFALFCVYTAAVLVAGAYVLRRRDV